MKSLFFKTFIIPLLVFQAYGQNQVEITIDKLCAKNIDTLKADGKLGVYGGMQISKYPYWVNDTLIKELDFKQNQKVELTPQEYTLKYIPYDKNQKTRLLYFNSYQKTVELNCFFFNTSYTSFIKSLNHNDYFSITSRYAGPTNMDTNIPIYTLVIVKKRKHYYANFKETHTNEQGMLILENIKYPKDKRQKINLTKDYIKLTEQQLKTIKEFEKSMSDFVLDYNSGNKVPISNNFIRTNAGDIYFYSQYYPAERLWKQIKND